MHFERFAIYYVPPIGADWGGFATSWLGWDVNTGKPVEFPELDGPEIEPITRTPRKYGLHATVKPPFRLANGTHQAALEQAVADLCDVLTPVRLDGLHLAQLGRFLALRPLGDEAALNAMAAMVVERLDPFRAPAGQAELDRRRANGLSEQQDRNLTTWGYPFVMEDFRFHITLSSKLSKPELAQTRAVLETQLVPMLPQPFDITELALAGEDSDGRFHMIHRYALSG